MTSFLWRHLFWVIWIQHFCKNRSKFIPYFCKGDISLYPGGLFLVPPINSSPKVIVPPIQPFNLSRLRNMKRCLSMDNSNKSDNFSKINSRTWKNSKSRFSKNVKLLFWGLTLTWIDSRIDVSGIKNFRKRFAVTNDPILIIINCKLFIGRHENTMIAESTLDR